MAISDLPFLLLQNSLIMEIGCMVFVSLFFSISIAFILSFLRRPSSPPLPPGPFRVPIIGSVLWLRASSFSALEPVVRNLHAKYGPIITLHIASFPVIFISDRFLAHQALVQNGAVFSDRPKGLSTPKLINSHQDTISSALYSPTWRLLRRNLSSEIFSPARIQSFLGSRKRVLKVLVKNLKSCSESRKSIRIIDHLQHAMFHLLAIMCFGENLDDEKIKDIENVQRRLLSNYSRFTVLSILPKVSRIIFRKRRQEFLQLREEQHDIMVPLVRARRTLKGGRMMDKTDDKNNRFLVSYVDALLDLQRPEEKRKLEETEIITLCSEFLTAGTDTTATALEWTMANLVKYPEIQRKLVQEIRQVMSERDDVDEDEEEVIKEEDLRKMPYLKAVILEGLRRHPPAHFTIPHGVSKDVILNGYLVPKKGAVNFMVADMGWDPDIWEDPMEFKPERFLGNINGDDDEALSFDITGSKEIKMMPFGAGRRICPAYNLAMLHLGYFVANLIWKFEWKASEDDVDLSEKHQFTVVMKNSLQVHINPRSVT